MVACREFCWLIFCQVLSIFFQKTLAIYFQQFEFGELFGGYRCVPDGTIFETKNVINAFECAKMCYTFSICFGFFYHPDLLKCIGCHGTEFQELKGSVYYARYDIACPPGWFGDGGRCYFFSSDHKNWTDALATCREMESVLVEVEDAVEHDYLMSKMQQGMLVGYWIGLTDKEKNNRFVWNTSGVVPASSFWAPSEPTHTMCLKPIDEDCVVEAFNGIVQWTDAACEAVLYYICERHSDVACPPEWLGDRGRCYFLSSDPKNWTDALEACREMESVLVERDMESVLVEVEDAVEHDYLMSKMQEWKLIGYWIGLTDKKKNNRFVWNTSGDVPAYSFWVPGEPEDTICRKPIDEDCVIEEFNSTGVWNDVPCDSVHFYICERQRELWVDL